jgi:hypothetical protein
MYCVSDEVGNESRKELLVYESVFDTHGIIMSRESSYLLCFLHLFIVHCSLVDLRKAWIVNKHSRIEYNV